MSVLATGCWIDEPFPSGPPPFEPPASTLSTRDLRFELIDAQAAPGGSIRLRQFNGGTLALYYNHCSRGVERLTSSGWWEPGPPELRLCPPTSLTLAAGQTDEVAVDVPTDAMAGRYRFVLRFFGQDGASAGAERSPEFEVSQ
ncbi:MAG: hypothetical protein KF709_02960 [Gemmatimonadaceae bacterium]|nr:hypothetical protein [Gemmatimonadaceae bacterium]